MFPRPTELLLIRLFSRINLDPNIQIEYIDHWHQEPTRRHSDKAKFQTWWMESFLCLYNISHFSSINGLEAMSKRTQEDGGEERVTAKSKPMMNLVSRCSVRDPNVLPSTALESLEKSRSGCQLPFDFVDWAASKNGETCDGRKLIRLLRMENWWQVVFSRLEIWWNVEHKYGDTHIWQVCHP